MDDLTTLVTGENAAFIGAIVVILSTLKTVFPVFFMRDVVKRFMPLAPLVLAIVGVFLGFGTAEGALTAWQDKLVLGFLVGFTSGQLYKAGKVSMFGPNPARVGVL